MKVLKWIGIGVGGLAAVGGALFALLFTLTAGATDTATDFLRLVSEDKYEAAYQATTPQFRKEISLDQFRANVKLSRFESVSWHGRAISTDTGAKVEGTIKIRDGITATAIINLQKIDGAWKVYGVSIKRDAS